jgi:hypothetical protein
MTSIGTPRDLALLATLGLGGAACTAQALEPFEEPSLRVSSGGRAATLPGDPEGGVWINNGLDDPDVSGVDPAFALASPAGLDPTHGLLLDPDSRDTVQYLVECALPEGHEITKLVDGEWLSFPGWLGLAPEWEDEPCDEDCQEWVSACLLARTNVSGQSVAVWMRADHPAIGQGTSLLYPAYEASFFGNVFADPESQHFCKGSVLGPLLSQLEGRTCAGLLDESCGFIKYSGCQPQLRCTFANLGLLGILSPSASNCKAGSLIAGLPFHTINTYVGPL